MWRPSRKNATPVTKDVTPVTKKCNARHETMWRPSRNNVTKCNAVAKKCNAEKCNARREKCNPITNNFGRRTHSHIKQGVNQLWRQKGVNQILRQHQVNRLLSQHFNLKWIDRIILFNYPLFQTLFASHSLLTIIVDQTEKIYSSHVSDMRNLSRLYNQEGYYWWHQEMSKWSRNWCPPTSQRWGIY